MEPSRRPGRRFKTLLVVLGVALALCVGGFVLLLGLAWLHVRTTPDFTTYVREHPVAEPLDTELWPEAEVLASASDWSIGEVDPFALAEDDPELDRWRATWHATLRHGDDLLLDLVQEVAIAADRESGDRRGVAVRTTRCATASDMRACVRLWVSDPDELLGPGSVRHGQVDFDALMLAGAGDDRIEVVLRPERGPPELEPTDPLGGWWSGLLGHLLPGGTPPEEGLVHHVRQRVFLTWMRRENGYQNLAWGDPAHQVNTTEYSYSCEVSLESQGSTTTTSWASTHSWNGRVW